MLHTGLQTIGCRWRRTWTLHEWPLYVRASMFCPIERLLWWLFFPMDQRWFCFLIVWLFDSPLEWIWNYFHARRATTRRTIHRTNPRFVECIFPPFLPRRNWCPFEHNLQANQRPILWLHRFSILVFLDEFVWHDWFCLVVVFPRWWWRRRRHWRHRSSRSVPLQIVHRQI